MKRNFAKHSVLTVEIKDKVDRLKVPRDISTLIVYIIDNFRNTTSGVYQKLVRTKKRNETRISHCKIVEKLICQLCLFRFAILRPSVSRPHSKCQEMSTSRRSENVRCKNALAPKECYMRPIGASKKHVHQNRKHKNIQERPCSPGPSKVSKNLFNSPCPSEGEGQSETRREVQHQNDAEWRASVVSMTVPCNRKAS